MKDDPLARRAGVFSFRLLPSAFCLSPAAFIVEF
jgi:hypothetical protein